jgi:phosphatidylserine/phosphatidylglycerophosphate/cardiolipin synthase-like enzyme
MHRFSYLLFTLLLAGSLWTFKSHALQVYFSPQKNLDTVVIEEIQKAKKSIDIAIYTFRSEPIVAALVEKLKSVPEFELRLLIRKVSLDDMLPYMNPLEKTLLALNLKSTNIRFVNVTNHHKFMLVDQKTLVNTSGNFNDSELAATYDENLFVCSRSCPDLVKAFQSEFDYLYEHSNFLLLDEVRPFRQTALTYDSKKFKATALFTSENFEPSQRADRLVFRLQKDLEVGWVEKNILEHIALAKKSIKVATGHLRSYTLAEALRTAAQKGIQVELILDSQEYLSPKFQALEDQEKEACLQSGESLEQCVETGFHFGRWLHEQGVEVYFKYYMIFWDFIEAPQMHHKYMIVDDNVVLTGSHNWSKNAEFKTFENKAVIRHKASVQSFINNFKRLKNYGSGELQKLKKQWAQEAQNIDLIFEPMALSVSDIDSLRDLLSKKCPALFKNSDTLPATDLAEDETEALSSASKHVCKVQSEQ